MVACFSHGGAKSGHVLIGVYCFSSKRPHELNRGECSVPNHFLGVEGARVSFGKREAQVRALRGVSQFFERGNAFASYGTLGQRENHVIVSARLFVVAR